MAASCTGKATFMTSSKAPACDSALGCSTPAVVAAAAAWLNSFMSVPESCWAWTQERWGFSSPSGEVANTSLTGACYAEPVIICQHDDQTSGLDSTGASHRGAGRDRQNFS